MPTVWGFVAITQLGVVNSVVYKIRRRYYGNAPIHPVLNGVVAVKMPLLERKYIIRYGKEKCMYEYEKLLYDVQK